MGASHKIKPKPGWPPLIHRDGRMDLLLDSGASAHLPHTVLDAHMHRLTNANRDMQVRPISVVARASLLSELGAAASARRRNHSIVEGMPQLDAREYGGDSWDSWRRSRGAAVDDGSVRSVRSVLRWMHINTAAKRPAVSTTARRTAQRPEDQRIRGQRPEEKEGRQAKVNVRGGVPVAQLSFAWHRGWRPRHLYFSLEHINLLACASCVVRPDVECSQTPLSAMSERLRTGMGVSPRPSRCPGRLLSAMRERGFWLFQIGCVQEKVQWELQVS